MKRISWTIIAAVVASLFLPVNAAQATSPAPSLWVSRDGVVGWNPSERNRISSMSVNANGSFMAVTHNRGDLFLSANGGITWVKQDGFGLTLNETGYAVNYGSAKAVQVSSDASTVAVAADGGIYMSSNFGTTWVRKATGFYLDISMSADGTKLIARKNTNGVFISTDSGSTWSEKLATETFALARISGNGNLMVAASSANSYTSIDNGTTWTTITTGIDWSEIVMSADGSKMYATQGGNVAKNFFTSNNNGLAWTQSTNFPGLQMARGQIASSADGLTLYASPYWRSGPWGPLSSRDGGATWTVGVIDDPYRGIQTAVSANGKVALYTLTKNSVGGAYMFTYDDDFIVSSDASFTMKINGTAVTDGQTFQLTPNSKTVNVSVVATESAATFGGFTCTQPGTCVKAEYYLGNYYNNESGTDQVVVTAVAPNRVDRVTKTITVTQPFTKRTILNYNANENEVPDSTNSKQEITSGKGLPAFASKTGYHFNLWSDGVTANPRTDSYSYGKNINVAAIFGKNATVGKVALNYHSVGYGGITAADNDDSCIGFCTEVPSGSDGPEVTASPWEGYAFLRWSDGSTANPRKDVKVKANVDIYAIFAQVLEITTNNVTGEKVAAVPSGTPSATIPATVDIPLTTLKFDNAPSGAATVSVKPIANPAAASATPFKSSSAKIVDIKVTGIDGPVTVCLDGGPTDSIFHFVGGKWAELPSRTYVGGQVCGVTTSFSPFAAAPAVTDLPGLVPTFSAASSLDYRFTVKVANYDSAYTYTVTATPGTATISSTGLVTVTNLGLDSNTTVTVTTTRTGYESASASIGGRSQVAAMLPSDKPVVTTTATSIMCAMGVYSAKPTSAAFSLFVDGKHVSTSFSATGEYLPDWIIPWATSSTITRTASLTSASWTMSDAYKGKAVTCTTLAYSKNAVGLTSSKAVTAP